MKIRLKKPVPPTLEQRRGMNTAIFLLNRAKRKAEAFDWWFIIGVNAYTLRENGNDTWLLRRVGIPRSKERIFTSALEAIEAARTDYDSDH